MAKLYYSNCVLTIFLCCLISSIISNPINDLANSETTVKSFQVQQLLTTLIPVLSEPMCNPKCEILDVNSICVADGKCECKENYQLDAKAEKCICNGCNKFDEIITVEPIPNCNATCEIKDPNSTCTDNGYCECKENCSYDNNYDFCKCNSTEVNDDVYDSFNGPSRKEAEFICIPECEKSDVNRVCVADGVCECKENYQMDINEGKCICDSYQCNTYDEIYTVDTNGTEMIGREYDSIDGASSKKCTKGKIKIKGHCVLTSLCKSDTDPNCICKSDGKCGCEKGYKFDDDEEECIEKGKSSKKDTTEPTDTSDTNGSFNDRVLNAMLNYLLEYPWLWGIIVLLLLLIFGYRYYKKYKENPEEVEKEVASILLKPFTKPPPKPKKKNDSSDESD